VFTRAQLLAEVWDYDFFGGTRTVDVHVRRLRAKLGPEYEQLIGTVRNVGYKFIRPVRTMSFRQQADHERAAHPSNTSAYRADLAAKAFQQALDSGPPQPAPAAAPHLSALP
jgi:DNA-binding winged helix-turn-helix (wHTH) protein